MPADVEIAAGLNHEIAQPAAAQDRDRALDRVALADAAEVDAHALAPQEHRAGRDRRSRSAGSRSAAAAPRMRAASGTVLS